MEKTPTPKETIQIVKRLTPEQRRRIEAEIADAFAQYRRSQFKLIRGGKRPAV